VDVLCYGMSNNYFKFKQFTVFQEHCAMKVGTDGTLLGAWTDVSKSKKVLDIGTGTGLISLMLAQRTLEADICAIDIDKDAVCQAKLNVGMSQWQNRITVECARFQDFNRDKYDTIVSNPPYFIDSLTCPDKKRSAARHAQSLTYSELIDGVTRLLTEDGCFSVIVPFNCFEQLNDEALFSGLSLVRKYAVKTTPQKPIRRFLLAYKKMSVANVDEQNKCIEDEHHHPSEWYMNLTKDFYL
jgi:tRNA1Val (adenine37-N6)-methyltransferase